LPPLHTTGRLALKMAWGAQCVSLWLVLRPWEIQDTFPNMTSGTLPGTNISPQKWHFEDDFPFPQVGYVNSLEGI